jgi:cytochrome c-type biogenesis protein CcmE
VKKKFIIGGGIVVAVAAYLIFIGTGSQVSYYLTVSELEASGPEIADSSVRVAGRIAEGSVVWDAPGLELKFDVVEGEHRLPVVYHGAMPAGFTGGSEILVEGKYRTGEPFEATQLITRCPSKYEAAVE